ncbi:MAG: hypothetical protein NC336_07765 [Clostridium sp.]|nr:hypothetical protein [Clostridium sp.]
MNYIKAFRAITTAVLAAISLIALAADPAATGINGLEAAAVDSQFNALDYLLQKPLPSRQFEHKRFGDHMFITGGAGISTLRRQNSNMHPESRIGFRVDLNLGDWITPVHGWRIGLSAGQSRTSDRRDPYWLGVSADYLLNFSTLLRGYDPSLPFELIGTAGAEYRRMYSGRGWDNAAGLRIGLQARVNLSPSTFIYVEPRFGVYTDRLDGLRSWQRYDWEASVMLGLGYRVIWGPSRYRGRYRFESVESFDNIFYGISGAISGVSHSALTRDYRNRIGGQGSLFFGKWFSAASALRLSATLGTVGRQARSHRNYVAAELDYIVNLNSAFNGYRPGSRFESSLAVGPAVIYAGSIQRKFYPGIGAGWQLMWNASSGFGLFVEPHVVLTSPNFWNGRHHSNDPFDLLGSINVGFQYRIDAYNRINGGRTRQSDYEEFYRSNRSFMTAGAGLFTTRRSFARRFAAYGGLGQWFTPYSAWRLGLDWEYNAKPTKFMSLNLDLDYLASLSSLSAGYDPDRLFDLSVVAGGQAGAVHDKGKNAFTYGFKGGLNGRFRLSRSLDFYLEPEFLAQHLYNYGHYFTPQFRLMAGFVYKLGVADPRHLDRFPARDRERNTYVSLSAGPSLFSETMLHRSTVRVNGGADIALGHWFSRCSAFQLGYSWDNIDRLASDNVNLSTLRLDYLLNLSQLFAPDPGRIFSITPHIGAGVAWSSVEGSGTGWAAGAGVRFGWNLPGGFGLFLDPDMTLWQKKMCPVAANTHGYVGVGRLKAGLTWRF